LIEADIGIAISLARQQHRAADHRHRKREPQQQRLAIDLLGEVRADERSRKPSTAEDQRARPLHPPGARLDEQPGCGVDRHRGCGCADRDMRIAHPDTIEQ
jgi:hypothetical protein